MSTNESKKPAPKYPHPKILLMDVQDGVEEALASKGYDVAGGSFGTPYKVQKSELMMPIIRNGNFPGDFNEREIVVIDLKPKPPLEEPVGERDTINSEPDWWAKCNIGVIDPRPKSMFYAQEKFNRIYNSGGVFIIFSSPRIIQETEFGNKDRFDRFEAIQKIKDDNWSFLPFFDIKDQRGWDIMGIKRDWGKHVKLRDDFNIPVFETHLKDATFECTFEPQLNSSSWISLAKNKYDVSIAGLILSELPFKPLVMLLPEIKDQRAFLIQLFEEFLSGYKSSLFPYHEGKKWVHRPEYELPSVLNHQEQIRKVEESTKKKIEEIRQQIEKERSNFNYLYDLLRETDAPLVKAVKKALEVIGFTNVVDIDEEIEKTGEKKSKAEDLQIRDRSPLLLAEVKGISGLPRDEELQAAQKYVTIRMREQNRVDINSLLIVNHQRHLLALERNNDFPFNETILVNAIESKTGLLTTWDLFKLVRNYIKNGWQYEFVESLFYEPGRISYIPVHYELLGEIEHFYDEAKVIGFPLNSGSIEVGDRIAIEAHIDFEEVIIESMQVEGQSKEKVEFESSPIKVAIKGNFTKDKTKKGFKVYKIKSPKSETSYI